tara:strand:+ start:61 stop:411 length:351 start_codon:yes stop_codon:yes gene_type:complete
MNKTKLRKLIKEELTKYLEEIPQTPTDAGREMGQDPTGDETSTLGLEEAEASHAFGIGMKIVEDWRPFASSPGAITKAWQSLFEALDELEKAGKGGLKIAKQLKEISDNYLKDYGK